MKKFINENVNKNGTEATRVQNHTHTYIHIYPKKKKNEKFVHQNKIKWKTDEITWFDIYVSCAWYTHFVF